MTYSYSFDDEHFNGEFETIEETLKEAENDSCGDYKEVYIGENGVFKPFVDGDDIIERVQQEAFDEVGEIAEIYLDNVAVSHTQELSSLLTNTFNEWAKKYGYEPNVFPVNNIKKYALGNQSGAIK